ncbi:hypothetical protein Q1W73_16455 [Asticcacaulis sp. ZE23SCel15]|uniref:hypothetical protein n=1 Tax=Asticcacaulis sp. ZE23SCel15 TaxID=3059027 RepID=UPI00265D635E|nr:hypothetical protein [Asticcacaulis sp. ZE23SCel15]WKL57235.1 hypothetical protein Q1W73_16455 [Asticcacaulis sp. ZE23SCel15]
MITWPHKLWSAPQVGWTPSLATTSGGQAANALNTYAVTDGGGKWTASLSGIWLRKRDHLLAMRAIQPALARYETIILPSCECRFKPIPAPITKCHASVPHSDDATFSDGTEYDGGVIDIYGAAASLRAVYLRVSISAAAGLRGGEHFSIDHVNEGRRMYVIESLSDDDPNLIRVWPPLREAVSDNTVLDFDAPSCVMRCTNPDAFFGEIEGGRYANANATFIEVA